MSNQEMPFSEAAERNKAPILEVLSGLLPGPADILEVASGTGQHAVHFAALRPDWRWQPTEVRTDLLAAIARRCAGRANVAAPVALDVRAPDPVPARLPVNTRLSSATLPPRLMSPPPLTLAALLLKTQFRIVAPIDV